ncbi:uncharacterized protein Tco_0887017 [Tanacetum coccineum]
MEASTAQSNSQSLKRNSKDVGWEFGFLVDPNKPDKVECKICGKLVSGGINRLKQHVAGIVGNTTACPRSTNEQKMICRNAVNEAKRKKKGKEDDDVALRAEVNIGSSETVNLDEMEDAFGCLKSPSSFGPMDRFTSVVDKGNNKEADVCNVIRKEQVVKVKEYICRFAYECAIPFNVFEKDCFKKLLEAVGQFGPRALPPTRYEMGDTFLKKEVERTNDLLSRYRQEWKSNGCSIMTDAWSDRKRRSIMNLCVNSKLGTVFLSSKECSNEAHTSQHIFEYVDSCIEEVGPENVVQVVTDNASNNMGASTLLKAKRPTIFWTSCATHTINLMLEAIGGLPRYKKILDQAKRLTIFIYAHHKTLALMRQFTKKRDIVRPGVTRFASSFLTLQSLAEKKSQLRHMFSSDEWEKCKFSNTVKRKAAYGMVLSSSFWAGVTLCLKVFAPLVKVLRMVDAD